MYSYVVRYDYGFAPNPFYGICTLATCKPDIRSVATLGDWVVGTGSKMYGLEGRLVYYMRISEAMSYDAYWSDKRFRRKRPNLRGSEKQAYGDNIYRRAKPTGEWKQEDSHHSLPDGSANPLNVAHDTRIDRVLVATQFAYWGSAALVIPAQFRDFAGADVCAVRGHKCRFSDELVAAFAIWLESLGQQGVLGPPMEWTRSR